jgi:hypothetical protein
MKRKDSVPTRAGASAVLAEGPSRPAVLVTFPEAAATFAVVFVDAVCYLMSNLQSSADALASCKLAKRALCIALAPDALSALPRFLGKRNEAISLHDTHIATPTQVGQD